MVVKRLEWLALQLATGCCFDSSQDKRETQKDNFTGFVCPRKHSFGGNLRWNTPPEQPTEAQVTFFPPVQVIEHTRSHDRFRGAKPWGVNSVAIWRGRGSKTASEARRMELVGSGYVVSACESLSLDGGRGFRDVRWGAFDARGERG